MQNYAVLTGDIVASSKLKEQERGAMLSLLKDVFNQLKEGEEAIEREFDVFRGDSFQVLLNDPLIALEIALYIRLNLIADQERTNPHDWDARIAIGLGEVEYWGEDVATSDGPVFRNSGPILDEMKGSERLKITSPDKEFNKEMDVATALLDGVSSRWTSKQAQVMLETMAGKTQKEIALEMSVSQPAISKMLKIASWEAVDAFIKRYQYLVEKIKQNP